MLKNYMFSGSTARNFKRFSFILEDITINARLIRIYTACGLNANISNRFYFESLNFINYYVSRNLILQELTSIYNLISDASSIHVNILKLVGTGYKCIVPRRYNFKKLYLRVGFAASELIYSNNDARVKIRARRQKILLFGVNKALLTQISRQIINLRYPNVYTGKGIRAHNGVVWSKQRRQQQRK